VNSASRPQIQKKPIIIDQENNDITKET